MSLPPIYPITDKRIARSDTHLSILRELVRGGATWVQIRDKETPVPELLEDLRRCVDFARGRGVTLIVNDRCDLVLSSNASGVHLGQRDLPPAEARRILGQEKIVGHSTHDLPQMVRSRDLPLDYVAFGPVFATATKKEASPVVGLRGLRQACTVAAVPLVAIGGIGLQQISTVLEAGASSVAVISDLLGQPPLARRMEAFLTRAKR